MDAGTTSAPPSPAPSLSAAETDTLAALFERAPATANARNALPPPSPLTFRLLSLDLDSARLSHELTTIVESDPVLTARILGIANSAAFGLADKPLFSVGEAVLRLGTDIVREIGEAQLLGLWMRHGARLVDQGLLRDLWLEYLMTAHSARAITEALGDDLDPVLLYAAGLLHDIGTLALCWEEPHAMARFIRTGYGYGTPLREAFVQAHSRLGGTLLRQWRAPAALAITAERHHNALGPRETATTLVVFLADHLHAAILAREDVAVTPTGEFALGCFGGATEPVSAALAALGLTEKLDKILAEVGATSHRLELAAAAVGG